MNPSFFDNILSCCLLSRIKKPFLFQLGKFNEAIEILNDFNQFSCKNYSRFSYMKLLGQNLYLEPDPELDYDEDVIKEVDNIA